MARLAQIACAVTAIMAATAVAAGADPINILSGTVFIESPGGNNGFANLVGTRGFSLTASASLPTARGLFEQCMFPECVAGTRIDFNLGLSGASESLDGVMTIEGDHYVVNSSINPEADAFLLLDGSIIAPDTGPSQATVSAPFTLTGLALAASPLGGIAHHDELFGRGRATVTLVPFPPQAGFPPSWMVDSVRFDFAQPTPEPSTLLLLGTCAFAPVVRRSRRSRMSQRTCA